MLERPKSGTLEMKLFKLSVYATSCTIGKKPSLRETTDYWYRQLNITRSKYKELIS